MTGLRATWIILALFLLTPCAGQSTEEPAAPIPDVQEQIEGLVTGVIEANRGGAPKGLGTAAQELLQAHADRRPALLQQIVLYGAAHPGNEPAMATALLIQSYGFTVDEKLEAVLPLLESEDGWLRDAAGEILSTVDRVDGGSPDFHAYVQVLSAGRHDPTGLLRYMYGVSPIDALATTTAAYHGSDQVAATVKRAKVVQRYAEVGDERAAARLEELSKDPAWWVRLHAVYLTRVYPELGSPEIASRLARDPHRQVRSVFE